MSENRNCGQCAVMRPSDGYCKTTGQYVNALAVRNCFVPKEELAELKPLPAAPKLPKEKTCKACGRTLPLDDFPPHNTSRDRHDGVCKECKSKQMTAANEARARRLEAAIGTDKHGNEVPMRHRHLPENPGMMTPLTDEQMVQALRDHGWTVVCTREEKL